MTINRKANSSVCFFLIMPSRLSTRSRIGETVARNRQSGKDAEQADGHLRNTTPRGKLLRAYASEAEVNRRYSVSHMDPVEPV
jgi:hypothetical protein